MIYVIEKTSIFDDEISQEDTGSKTTDYSESDDTVMEDDIEMSENHDDNPTTIITTNISNHRSSAITDNTIYEYIHRDYFVHPKNQEINNAWRDKNVHKWDKLKQNVSDEMMDCLKTRMIVEAQTQQIKERINNTMVDVYKWSNIGNSFKHH